MNSFFSIHSVLFSALAVSACASVPDVENRLQSMQLHSNMYVVQAGETAESIAYRYRLTLAELEALNPGITNSIVAGLRINVRPGTILSNEVRTRATYAPVRQPQLVAQRRTGQLRPQQQVVASNQVTVVPVQVNPEIQLQRVESVVNETVVSDPLAGQPVETVITEIAATSWANEQVVVAEGNCKEEIVPDTLEYEPVQGGRAAINEQLQQYVGEWAWPTEGPVAREFAPHEVGGQGVDIAGTPGQDVRAAMAGTVVYSGRDLSGGGNLIIVKHNENLMTTYAHADQLFVAEDDHVVAGDPIASLGWNANRESVLRFEVREDGNAIDPMKFLPLR